jgi:hypothetical protein
MALGLDPKQIVSFEELPTSQVVQEKALTKFLVRSRILGGWVFC